MKFNDHVLRMLCNSAQEAMEKFERELAIIREAIAERLEKDNQIRFTHRVQGRLHTDELEPKFEIGSETWSGGTVVEGGSMYRMVTEYLRRRGYEGEVETRYLPRPRSVLVTNDEKEHTNLSNDEY